MEDGMSIGISLALTIATLLAGGTIFFFLSRLAETSATDLVSGVSKGAPLPLKYRWTLLHQYWLNYALGAMFVSAFGAAALLTIREHTPDLLVQRLALFGAFLGGVSSFAWMIDGIAEYIYYRSVLRKAAERSA
jgi:hypothetical protein